MRLCRKNRSRRSWNRWHIIQLADGFDWLGHGFGRLNQLPEEQIREAADEMLDCWQEREADVRERAASWGISPWFEQYALDLESLVQHYVNDPMHAQRVEWRRALCRA